VLCCPRLSDADALQATGTIDERIYQRQIAKSEIATTVVDSKATDRNFSASDLRQLFLYNASCESTTAELMRQKRPNGRSRDAWAEFDMSSCECPVMQKVASHASVSFVHRASSKRSDPAADTTTNAAVNIASEADCNDSDDLELESDSD